MEGSLHLPLLADCADSAVTLKDIVNDRKQGKPSLSIPQRNKRIQKSSASSKWSTKDTGLFYEYLQLHGTEFNIIQQYFPEKSREQIKNKFKKEEKVNPSKIQKSL